MAVVQMNELSRSAPQTIRGYSDKRIERYIPFPFPICSTWDLHSDNGITGATALDENGNQPAYLVLVDGQAQRSGERDPVPAGRSSCDGGPISSPGRMISGVPVAA